MVTVIDFKERKMDNGNSFFVLILQDGIEAVKSIETGKIYFKKKIAQVATTFDEISCQDLIGETLNGSIQKLECDPYEYENKETGEIVEFTLRNEYVDEALEIIDKNVVHDMIVE